MGKETAAFEQVRQLTGKIIDSISMMDTIPDLADDVTAKWLSSCTTIKNQIESDLLRVAVVGVIKSGKSTFINSFLEKEVVKRGAGVVTSITTRIQKAKKKNTATLYLKSWDDVNLELRRALLCAPAEKFSDEIDVADFDLRRKKDRDCLKEINKKLLNDFSVSKDGIRQEILLISNAIDGYESCKDLVQADNRLLAFSGRQFRKHQEFTSDAAKAFFVKDVCLEIVCRKLVRGIELADCQGADSTDAAQVRKILNYLESSNFIIYLISSRTGLRQTDIQFLSTIREMGLLENIIFINNCDISEHDNFDDLKRIDRTISKELAYIKPDPVLFSFSSLYILFSKLGSSLSEKDNQRLKYWSEDKKIINYCSKSYDKFHTFFLNQMEKERFDLHISNSAARLNRICSGALKKINLYLNLISDDEKVSSQSIEKVKELNQSSEKLEAIVGNSLKSSASGLKKDLESNVENFFKLPEGEVYKRLSTFINTYVFDYQKYDTSLKLSEVNSIIYLMFQDFRSELDLFIAKKIHPEITGFIRQQETLITEYFSTLDHSYDLEALNPTYSIKGISQENLKKLSEQTSDREKSADIQKIKKILGLAIPELVFITQYSGQIKVHAFAGFSLTSIKEFFLRILNKQNEKIYTPSFEKTAENLKTQSLKLISKQLDAYRNKIMDQYLNPLVDAVSRDFNDKIFERFHMYGVQFKNVEQFFHNNKNQKENQKESIEILINNFKEIINSLKSLKNF